MSSDIVQCPGGWETELPPVENHCSRVKSVLQPEGKWGLGGRKSNTTKPLSVRSVPGPGCAHASVCGLPAARSLHSETTCLLTACAAQSLGASSPSSSSAPTFAPALCFICIFFYMNNYVFQWFPSQILNFLRTEILSCSCLCVWCLQHTVLGTQVLIPFCFS